MIKRYPRTVILAALIALAVPAAAHASAWDRPALVSPVTIDLSTQGATQYNDSWAISQSQDVHITCSTGTATLPHILSIWGGRNVVWDGGCNLISNNTSFPEAGVFKSTAGTLWVANVNFTSTTGYLLQGIQMDEGSATVVLRDVLFGSQLQGSYSTNHAECVQTWAGPARLLIDGLTCNTTYQGLFLLPSQYGAPTPTAWDLRNIDITGDGAVDYYFADSNPIPTWSVQGVYDCGTGEPRDYDGTSDGGAAWAKVKPCPTPSGGHFAWAVPGGAYGIDDPAPLTVLAGEQ